MSLVACKECKKEVSKNAKTCPNCGIKSPGISGKDAGKGCLGLVVASLFIAGMLASCDDSKSTVEPMLSDTQCQQSLPCLAEKHIIYAGAMCQSPIQKMSQYSYEWTDGFSNPRFSRYRWVNKDKGIITYIGDEIKMQNGFGAWAVYSYECDFDTVNKAVIDVSASQGRID